MTGDLSAGRRVRQIMERQVGYMVRLVDDLLEISRVTRGTIELRKEPLDLAAVIHSAVEMSRPRDRSRRTPTGDFDPSGTDVVGGRRRAAHAGHLELAQQRRQVHAAAWPKSGLPHARRSTRSSLSVARQWGGDRAGTSAASL